MLITTVATTDFLLFGYDQGVMSGIIEGDAFLAAFPQAGYNSSWQGFIVSIYAVGCLCGAIFILKFGDKLGRRRAIFIGGITMIIGVIIQICCVGTSAGSTAQFIVGRFITGVSLLSRYFFESRADYEIRSETVSTRRQFLRTKPSVRRLTTEAKSSVSRVAMSLSARSSLTGLISAAAMALTT